MLEKWPLGNCTEANGTSPRPGFLAIGPGKNKVTSDALHVPSAYAIHMGPTGPAETENNKGGLALAADAENPPTTAAGALESQTFGQEKELRPNIAHA